jgi:hypothetical protein
MSTSLPQKAENIPSRYQILSYQRQITKQDNPSNAPMYNQPIPSQRQSKLRLIPLSNLKHSHNNTTLAPAPQTAVPSPASLPSVLRISAPHSHPYTHSRSYKQSSAPPCLFKLPLSSCFRSQEFVIGDLQMKSASTPLVQTIRIRVLVPRQRLIVVYGRAGREGGDAGVGTAIARGEDVAAF